MPVLMILMLHALAVLLYCRYSAVNGTSPTIYKAEVTMTITVS
jgi:hypothetical protein